MPCLKCNLCLEEYPRCDCGDAENLHLWIETSEIFSTFHDEYVEVPSIMDCEPYHAEVILSQLVPTQEYVSTKSINYFVYQLMNRGYNIFNAGDESRGDIRVYATEEGTYVVDGHHRISAMIMVGVPKCKVWYSESYAFRMNKEPLGVE